MADRTNISYCDATANPTRGCRPKSEGCSNCFASASAPRFCPNLVKDGRWTGEVELRPGQLEQVLRWKKSRIILWETMGDLFYSGVTDEYIATCFGVMAATPQHTHLVLTKRIERVRPWLQLSLDIVACALDYVALPPARFWDGHWPLSNVVIGTTVENQLRTNFRLPMLAQIAAMGWRTWVSVEPLLEAVDLLWPESSNPPAYCCSGGYPVPDCGCRGMPAYPPLLWPAEFVAVGAETGPGARPCELSWIRSIVRQCRTAGVRCHIKQLGRKAARELGLESRTGKVPEEWPEDLNVREMVK